MNNYVSKTAEDKPCIGLFGTCGGSSWRTPFMTAYDQRGYCYFNPQVEEWDPSCAEIEAKHLADDELILFPVTAETYGLGSLGEIGFSVMSAIKLDDRRDLVVLIEAKPDESLKDDPRFIESVKMRALIKQHLRKLRLTNVYLVETMGEMLELSLVLYDNALRVKPYKKFNPHLVVK
jgi:hypothetical protein